MKIIISLLVAVLFLQANENNNNNVLVLGSLMWQDEPYTHFEQQARYDTINYEKAQTWYGAMRYCKKLSLAGYSDWRLPSRSEITTILVKGQRPSIVKGFKNIIATLYWTATTHDHFSEDAYFLNFGKGTISNTYKSRTHYVRCVRTVE